MERVTEKEIELAFAALEAVGKDRSTKGKTAILTANRDNQVLKMLLYHAFNSFLQYYIKQIPVVEPASRPIQAENYEAFLMLLDDLNAHRRKDVKGAVADFLKGCNRTEQSWYTMVLLRDLQLGITQKGVNKVYTGLIPVYEVQLAETVKDVTLTDKKQLNRLPDAFVLQYKIDGYRLNIHKFNDGTVNIRTRSGLPVSGYTKLEEEAKTFLPGEFVYDGEMVSPKLFAWIEQNMLADKGEKIADRDLFKDAMRRCFSMETNKDGIFNIFDAVSMSEWNTQAAKDSYKTRLDFLNTEISSILNANRLTQMTVVPTSRVFYKNNADDMAEVIRIFHKFLNWGWEGLMIKSVDAPYAWKRSRNLLKMKLMDTADLEVLSIVEGNGAGAGMVGKLVCSYKDTVLNIGTGKMTAEEKKLYFENPNRIIGKTVEVAYQAENIGRNGEPVLDFARFMKIRKDK